MLGKGKFRVNPTQPEMPVNVSSFTGNSIENEEMSDCDTLSPGNSIFLSNKYEFDISVENPNFNPAATPGRLLNERFKVFWDCLRPTNWRFLVSTE